MLEPKLARFRADPKKVRVAVRKMEDGFICTIGPRVRDDEHPKRWAFGRTARSAIFRALHDAERQGMPGIDMSMGWAYEHPFKRQRRR